MKNQKETIRKFVTFLNNEDENGGFWLPNIQRLFVWKEEQIKRLFDSLLREYPIGTLLVWKTDNVIKRRKFINIYRDGMRLEELYFPADKKIKYMVLDGQQRLQTLFIGLKGSYNKSELYFNVLSGDLKSPDDMKFEFKFINSTAAKFPWVKIKEMVFTDKKNREIRKDIIDKSERTLSEEEKDRIDENIDLVRNVFCTQENIMYQEVDSTDRPDTYEDDDIVEIFIRANSGGTYLGKSDLLFSLLTSSWEEADEKMEDLLEVLNKTGYNFTRDFILKTCLVLFDKGARYQVDKFRDDTTRQKIEDEWDKVTSAIEDVKDFIYGNTFIQTDKLLHQSSQNRSIFESILDTDKSLKCS